MHACGRRLHNYAKRHSALTCVVVLQSFASPFTPGAIPRLSKAACLQVMLFLCAKDLAKSAAVSKHWKQSVVDAAGLACVSIYPFRLPTARPGESITRLLRFVETLTVVQQVLRVGRGFSALSAGTFHSLVTTANGDVYSFGDSAEGQVRSPVHGGSEDWHSVFV